MTVETGEFFIVKAEFKDVEISLKVNEDALETFHVDGVEEFSIDEPMVDEILGDRAYSGGDVPESVIYEVEDETKKRNAVIYKYYFFNGDIARAEGFAQYLSSNELAVKVDVEKQEFSDWNAEWRKHYAPIEVTENLKVVPEWFKEGDYKNDPSNIYINPGMGFGTGEHETTYLCLKLYDGIKDQFKAKELCLDFGCGSGILGIAAVKKSNMFVDFVDIDPAALDNCHQNLELNFEEDKLQGHALYGRNRFELKNKYELVFANILEHVLISEKELLLSSLAEKSYLVLSGILNDQVENILNEYSSLEHVETLSKGDWSAILLKK